MGVSQVVDPVLGAQVGHAWLLEQIAEHGSEKDRKLLEELGPPPYTDHKDFVKFVKMVDTYGGDFDVGMGKLAWVALRSPEYRLGDLLAWLRGANRGSGPMWDDPENQSFNAMVDIPELLVPVYFFTGKDDYNTPLQVTQRYFQLLEAPLGKHLVVFEASAHTPFLREAHLFNQELVRVK